MAERLPAAVVAVLVLLPFAVGAAAGSAPERAEVAFTLTDPEVVESSGLAPAGRLVVTVNDSGDQGRVFAVDPATGGTVGTTSWAPAPQDTEALAPDDAGHVWVGDVGDNLRRRSEVSVLRVPVGRGDRTATPETYSLRLPDGARDAEALLRDPVTGRLLVVTKGVFAGEVLAAPLALDPTRPNRLREVARTGGLVTDGAFLPHGGVVVLRDYARVTAYGLPAWEPIATWDAPDQPQGESLMVDGADLLLGSEGAQSEVLRQPLPPAVLAADAALGPLAPVRAALLLAAGLPVV